VAAPPFDVSRFFTSLAAQVAERASAVKKPWTIAFHMQEGDSYLLDLGKGVATSPVGDASPDAAVITNHQSVQDLAAGRLDPAAPLPGQVCLLTGEKAAFDDLARILAGGRSPLAMRLGR
jgi:hypothetical protein